MKPIAVAALVLALTSASLSAQKHPKKNTVSAAFNNAHYVYVQAEDGDITRPNLLPEDRQAIADVQDALRTWNRYVITINAANADLIFVVRKGRLASAQGTAGVSLGSSVPRVSVGSRDPSAAQDPGTDMGARGEVGPPDDMLRVFLRNDDNKRGAPIWTGRQDDGLDAPEIPLLRQLRVAVDQAYPVNPPPQQKP